HACALLFYVSYAPPAWLRVLWRQPELAELSRAESGLLTALTSGDVAGLLVPPLGRLFGGGGGALLDGTGTVLAATGLDPADLDGLADLVRAPQSPDRDGDAIVEFRPGLLLHRLASGALVVRNGPFAPVFDSDAGALLRRIGHLADLALQRVQLFNQERATRVALEHTNAELQSFIYSVSHDLRSPLISLLGYLEVLREQEAATASAESHHYLQRMNANALYMRALIEDLLELSRIGRSDTAPEAVTVASLVADVAEQVRLDGPGGTVECAGPLPRLRANPVRARQLFTNLIGNSFRHAGRADVAVTVSARPRPDGGVVISVADNGSGIPLAYREKVFQVFERLNPASGSAGGTGIGLTICRRIMESVGGQIEVGDPPDGSGAQFVLSFPSTTVVGWPALTEVP
ncbi:MAG: sensor histidine kinase, partial [Mycobacteriales bacterium]